MRAVILAAWIVGAGLAGAAVQTRPAGPDVEPRSRVRVHHLHFRVGDPAAALQAYAEKLGGTRVLLQGLGVGVRVGSHYFLFDRDRSGERARLDPAAAYRAAASWLSAHGVTVHAGDFAALPLAALAGAGPLDHVAFVSDDYPGTVDLLVSRGAVAVRRTEDAATFVLKGGLRIELVRDTSAPDAFWCPMHPGVRSGTTGKCPLCAMDLVPIPPARLGEYRMDVVVRPGPEGRGLGGLRLTVREPQRATLVSAFTTVHERPMHLFVIGRSLEYFAHVHPEPAGDGVFEVTHEAPPGEYVVIADFLPQAGTSQMVHKAIVTPGYSGPLFAPVPALRSDLPESTGGELRSAEKIVAGIRVRLEAADLVGGKRAALTFRMSDAQTGAPLTDLEPFLGAPGHLLIVNAALTDAIHVHPEETGSRGSSVTFIPILPAAGSFKLWVQVQRRGGVITVPFVMSVREP